jgi:molybdate transport system substrate-binding protein
MKYFIPIFLFCFSFLNAGSINIAVAANVSYAIDELVADFQSKNPSIKVYTTIGSSGKLTAQIRNGAPYDIFLSANMLYPKSLYKDKLSDKEAVVYALGSLSIVSQKARDFTDIEALLQNKNIKRIAIANPKTAPYGIATKEALTNLDIYTTLLPKFIYGESIAQTLSYTINAVLGL